MGHDSAPNTRYQKSVRGVGFRRLKKHGCLVIGFEQGSASCEHRTREYQIHSHIKDKIILKWFVLVYLYTLISSDSNCLLTCFFGCTDQNCKVTMQNSFGAKEHGERLWNRGLAACLNKIHLVRNLCFSDEILERLQCTGAGRRRSIKEDKSLKSMKNDEFYLEPCHCSIQLLLCYLGALLIMLTLKSWTLFIKIQLLRLLSLNVSFEWLVSFIFLI